MSNYTRGRAREYQVKKEWEEEGWKVLRTAGSHGEFDLIAYHPEWGVIFIQIKSVKTLTQAKKHLKDFAKQTVHTDLYHQVMLAYVKGGECEAVAI